MGHKFKSQKKGDTLQTPQTSDVQPNLKSYNILEIVFIATIALIFCANILYFTSEAIIAQNQRQIEAQFEQLFQKNNTLKAEQYENKVVQQQILEKIKIDQECNLWKKLKYFIMTIETLENLCEFT